MPSCPSSFDQYNATAQSNTRCSAFARSQLLESDAMGAILDGQRDGTHRCQRKKNTFTYDADNRLTNVSYSDGTSIAYTYDADSNRTSMADPHGTTSYTYDALDRLLPVVFLGGSTLTRINTGFLRYLKGKVKADFRHSRHTKGDALYS